MKKIFNSLLLLLCAACVLTGCKDDRDSNPTIKQPTSFVLNTPALADQFIKLSADNKVNLSWSQPDYGYNALATYQVQVGLTADDGSVKWLEEDGAPKYLETTFTECNVNVSGAEIAEAICELDGFEDKDEYVDMGYRKIAFRVHASILSSLGADVPGTVIESNTVYFNNLAAYCNIKSLGYLYIIGSCNGWPEPSAKNAEALYDWRIYETEIGSKVYKGEVEMPEGDLTFRFYSELTGWGDWKEGDSDDKLLGSIGWQKKDESAVYEFTDGVFEGACMRGKGAWQFNGFAGGTMAITVDRIQNKVKFEMVN